MTQKEVLDELKGLIVERLKFDPRRAAEMTLETTLPKGVEGSLGLDSLDFIELSVAIEERFGIVDRRGPRPHGRVPLAGFPVPLHPGQERPGLRARGPAPGDERGMSRSAARDGRAEVVVSGLGVVSPYGAGVKSFWSGLAAGACAIKPITVIDTEGFRSRIAAEVPAEVIGRARRRRAAARAPTGSPSRPRREALADAGLEGAARRDGRAARRRGRRRHARGRGLVLGRARAAGPRRGWARCARSCRSRTPRRSAGASASPGPKETVVMACASGAASIALGADLIRAGRDADRAGGRAWTR